jgi:hypothetical protein
MKNNLKDAIFKSITKETYEWIETIRTAWLSPSQYTNSDFENIIVWRDFGEDQFHVSHQGSMLFTFDDRQSKKINASIIRLRKRKQELKESRLIDRCNEIYDRLNLS